MEYEVVTHPEAFQEIQQTLSWLDERSLWSAKRMAVEYDQHVARIRSSPTSFRTIYGEYRRLNLNRFPYHIIYRLRRDNIFVIALAHDKRHPDYWKTRIADDQE